MHSLRSEGAAPVALVRALAFLALLPVSGFASEIVSSHELQACDLLVAVPQSPTGGQTVGALVTLRWRGPDLDALRLPFDLHPRYQVFVWRQGEKPTFAGETTETALTRFLEPGAWAWSVVGVVNGCRPRPSEPANFTIASNPDCPTAGPALLAPGPGGRVEGSTATLQWSGVEGADAYQVWLRRDPDSPFRAALTRRTEIDLELPEGAFGWRVDALVGGCGAVPSASSAFAVERCRLRAPLLLAPAEGASGLGATVLFAWARVPGASSYRLWARAERSLPDSEPVLLAEGPQPFHVGLVPAGTIAWWVEAMGESGCSASAPPRTLTTSRVAACPEGRAPRLVAAPFVSADAPFFLAWTPVAGAASWQLQESTDPSFSSPVSIPTSVIPVVRLERSVDARTTLYYRVRGVIACSASVTPYSETVAVTLTRELTSVLAADAERASGEVDLCIRGDRLRLCAAGQDGDNLEPVSLTLSADQPWLKLEPSVVTFPAGGRATIRAEVELAELSLGTSRATVGIAPVQSGKNAANGGTSGSVSVSLNLVTPVSSTPGASPTPDTVILPAVAHTGGAFGSTWESDVRLLNASPFVAKYEVSFTPTATDGSISGKRTEVDVAPGETIALDDVIESWFGLEGAIGSLTIRPLGQTSGLLSASSEPLTFASSRTFNISPNGTFGQFIPAVAFADFIGHAAEGGGDIHAVLQQLAQTDTFRTNFGLVEGSGEQADVELSIFDGGGARLATYPVHLRAGEHKQIDGLFKTLDISGENLRVETKVVSQTGRVTVYASRVDNRTGDPFVAQPVVPRPGRKWVVPGVAALDTGQANWRTDLRIHNAGTSPVDATLLFYPQGTAGQAPSPSVAAVTIEPGETQAIDDVLVSQWGLSNIGGAVHVTAESESELVVTGQTYDLSEAGTYGQFIPAVTPDQAVGAGGQTLQVLQIEESDRFRTNLGLAEVSGAAVTVEISAVVPESRVIPKATIQLAANEFRQIPQVIKALNLPSTYNGRIAVRATGGSGKVTAYASMVDNVTQDPTYVPAQ